MTDRTPAAKAMRAALDAGFSAFPLGANKRPAVKEWRPYIERPPELDEIKIWQSSDFSGYAVVMGGPERLLAIDLEAAFVTHRLDEFARRLRDEELEATWRLWMGGMMTATPSGGLHVVIHLMGDGPMPGNEKLAWADGKVIAETRAQGGYIVGYGSNGDCHPSGGPWVLASGGYDQIAWAEPEEWAGVRAVLVSFDEAPLAPGPASPAVPAVPGGVSLAALERSGSWIDVARTAAPTLPEALLHYGYVQDPHAPENWTRPGKDPRQGTSCTINASGRLIMWSTSDRVPFSGSPPTTFDAVDVIAFNEGVDRVDVLRRWRPERAAPAAADPSTVLPPEFWSARPYLSHIYDAALARFIPLSPDLLWMAFKTIFAGSVPWNFRLPDNGTLDYIGLMVGPSGSGKTSARDAALDLLPEGLLQIDGVDLMLPPGTGEGFAEHFIQRDKGGKQTGIWPRGASFYIDEGKWLFDVGARHGNTTIQALKQAWSGHLTGSLAATADRHRSIPPRAVRSSFLISIQPGQAARLLRADLEDEGLPQRVTWAMSSHPDVGMVEREHPGPLDIPVYDLNRWGGGSDGQMRHQIGIDPELRAEIRSRAIARRNSGGDALEGHADLACLKSAALHALLAGPSSGPQLPCVRKEDWVLAAAEWDTSRAIRTSILRSREAAAEDDAVAQGRAIAAREAAAAHVHIERAGLSLKRKIDASEEPLTSRQVKDHLRPYRQRHGITHTEVIELAASRSWVVVHSDGRVGRGAIRGGS